MLEISPLMEQYNKIKKNYPDIILMFRIGDFYEMFNEDAKIASKVLNIVLTSKPIQKDKRIPLAGVPYHSIETHINSLIKSGYKVAICEQVEDPKKVKGIVKREVIKVITSGTVVSPNLLEDKKNNFLVAINIDTKIGFARIDISTGEFLIAEFLNLNELIIELVKLQPAECLLSENQIEQNKSILNKELPAMNITSYPDWKFDFETCYSQLLEHFKVNSLYGFGCENFKIAITCAGAVITYLKELQKQSLTHITQLKPYSNSKFLVLDPSAFEDLEIIKTIRGEKQNSLLWILDQTITSMGGRMLRNWVLFPLLDLNKIQKRQEIIEEFINKSSLIYNIRDFLKKIYDIERIMGKIGCNIANARDLIALKNSLEIIPKIKILLKETEKTIDLQNQLLELKDVYELISAAIIENPPLSLREGNLIKRGYNDKVDELFEIITGGKNWIAQFETQEKQKTGINSLKVKYNKIFGYYIEITKPNLHLVPADYIKKQSMVNAERFITQSLKEYEEKVIFAEEQIENLEYNLFQEICLKIASYTLEIQKVAKSLAELDCLTNLAYLALKNNYIKPVLNEENIIKIIDARHPVVEQSVGVENFVSNDIYLDNFENMILIITGPNMAGKSTYIRQTALIVLMAQIGSFIPAKEAVIGIVDRIFTRIGTSDNLVKGQSTFMTEMNEVANILNNATSKSLIILDEVGRGTSTFDGISIAWAVTEYIYEKIQAKTLFATHYHELTELALLFPKIKNYNILVKEWNDEIIFVRKMVKGMANKSYGIQVAKLAGLPFSVISRAKEVLTNFENIEIDANGSPLLAKTKDLKESPQLNLFLIDPKLEKIKEEIQKLDLTNLTPLQALNKLQELQINLH